MGSRGKPEFLLESFFSIVEGSSLLVEIVSVVTQTGQQKVSALVSFT